MKGPVYATPQDAEAAFYDAIEKADLDAMMAVWADDDDIVCVHPGGTRLSGVSAVRESWRQIFSGGSALRMRLSRVHAVNGVTLVMHSVYEQVSVAGGPHEPATMIATNLYVRIGRGWRMLAHHASPSPEAPAESPDAPQLLH